jgi:hypothetical protein
LDFWDLTVVIFRRWKVSLPLLLLAIGATTYVALTAKPDYAMTSYVQLIPPRVALGPTDNPTTAALRNPWNQLGLNTLGQASIYATQDQKFLDLLKAEKHTDNFTLTMTYPNPIVTVEVIGSGPADARETTQLVIDRLRASVESLQRGAGVSDQDMIATQRLDQGLNLLPSRSKVKRAILAVAAAGLVMTAGGTVAFDALARRRSRKRREREQAKREQAGSPPDETTPETAPANGVEVPSPPKVPVPRTPPPAALDQTAIMVRSTAAVARPPATRPRRSSAAATYKSTNAQGETKAEHHPVPSGTNGDSAAAPSDFRIVLRPKRLGNGNGGKPQ